MSSWRGARAKAIREAASLSQADLAERLDISRRTVLEWEAGQEPRLRSAARLAELGGVSIDWLMGAEGHTQDPATPETAGGE